MSEDFEWTEAAHDRLRALWAEGHSTAEIGRIMKISKNAVVGKRKRLGLPERPSPIKRVGSLDAYVSDAAFVERFTAEWKSDKVRAQVAIDCGVSREVAYAIAKRLKLPGPARPVPVVTTLPPLASVGAVVVRVAAAPAGPVLRRVGKRGAPCDFPIGDPRKPGFRFCEAPSAVGSNYCPEHHAICWRPLVDRRAA